MKPHTRVWDGERVTSAAIYAEVTMLDYHGANLCAGSSISSSGLRTIFTKSPAHYWVESPYNPDRIQRKEPAHFALGRACHHLICGQPDFSTEFAIRPDELPDKHGVLIPWEGRRTACREWVASAQASGKTVLTPDMVENIRGMAISLGKHPLVRSGILNGLIERTMVFRDKETGIFVKARPDAIPTTSGDFSDLKTTADILFTEKAIRDYRYDMQAAIVRWAWREITGMDFSSFSFVFVESTPPWCVDVLVLDAADLDEGEADARAALRTFAACMKSREWFGPQGSQRDARTAYFPDTFRQNTKFRRELLEREIGSGNTAARKAS